MKTREEYLKYSKEKTKKSVEKWNKANPNHKLGADGLPAPKSKTSKKSKKETALTNLNKISARYGGVSTKNYHVDSAKTMNEKAKKTKAYEKYHSGYKGLDKIDRIIAGLGTGFVKTVVPYGLLGLPTETVFEKEYGKDLEDDSLYKWSKVGGTALGYLLPYGAASKATTKAGNAMYNGLAKTGLGKKLFSSATRANVGKGIMKNLAADATLGTVLNNNVATNEGLEFGTKEWAKEMGINAAMDFGLGSATELIGAGIKGAKNAYKSKVPVIVDGKVKYKKATLPEPRTKVKAPAPRSFNEAKAALQKKALLPTEKTSHVKAEHVAPEHKATFNQYVNATDRELKQFVENSRNGVRKKKDFKDFSAVGQREAADVKAVTGVDVSGYKHRLKTSTIQEHIDTRHGANGKADMSMADSNDIARMGYVLDDYDTIELLRNQDGTPLKSREFSNSDQTQASMVRFSKRIDGHYYVAVAVPDSNSKTLNIVSAYIKKADPKGVGTNASSGSVANALNPTPETPIDMAGFNNSIPDSAAKSNGKIGGFEIEGGENAIVSPDIKVVDDMVENAEGIFDKFYKSTVSGQHELEKMAKQAGSTSVTDNVQAVRNAKSTADNIITQRLVATNGRTIDERSFVDVVKKIPRKELKKYNEFAQHLHNIDRWNEGKPLFKDVSTEESQKIVDEILKEHPEYAQISKDITDWWNKFTHAWLVDTGWVNEEAWKAMTDMYPHYVPGFRVKKGMGGIGGAKGNRAQVGDAIKSAVGGYSEVIPMEEAFAAQIDRFVKNVRRNDLYLDIVDTLTNNKELQQFGLPVKERADDAVGSIDAFMTKLEKEHVKEVGDKAYMITAFRDGKKVSAYVNADVMRALELLDNAYSSTDMRTIAEFGQKFTNPVKAGITGINPLFAIANAARDIPTYLIQSNSNPFTAVSSLGKAVKEMVTGGELYHQYIGMGGKNAGYFAQGKGFRDAAGLDKSIAAKTWDTTKKILSVIGEGTETIPRLAEFINGIQKYGNTPEAVKRAIADSAEVTVNFSRSAPITKTLDAWTLYLNAAVQGLDKFARTVKAHPLRTAARSAGVISVPYALLMAVNWDNPNYQDLTERTKQNYFCIPNLAGEFDENGHATTFIKIPVNREYGAIFGSALDVIYGYMMGEEKPWKGYGETISTNFMPPSITADNITAPFKQNLPNNKDFAGRAIVPAYLENASPINQQDATTSGIAKWIAGAANKLGDNSFLGGIVPDALKSPMKVDYLIDSYGGYLGDVAQSVSSGEATNAKEFFVDTLGKRTFLEPFKQRFTADPVYSSGVVQDFYDEMGKLETAKTDAKLNGEEHSAANAQYKVYSDIQGTLSDYTKEEREILSDKSLTKEQREKKVKEIRRKRIALIRTAKEKAKAAEQEYNEAPNFSALDKKAKEKWQGSGVDKETFAKLYNSRTVKTGAGKTIANRINMVNAGGSYKEAKAVDPKLKKDAWQRAKNLATLGITPKDVQKISKGANYNKNGGLSAEELTSYLNQTNYSRYEKAYIFNALCPNVKYNPYT